MVRRTLRSKAMPHREVVGVRVMAVVHATGQKVRNRQAPTTAPYARFITEAFERELEKRLPEILNLLESKE